MICCHSSKPDMRVLSVPGERRFVQAPIPERRRSCCYNIIAAPGVAFPAPGVPKKPPRRLRCRLKQVYDGEAYTEYSIATFEMVSRGAGFEISAVTGRARVILTVGLVNRS